MKIVLGGCLDWVGFDFEVGLKWEVGLEWEIDGFDGGFEREDLAVWVIK